MSFVFGTLDHERFMREALLEGEIAGKAGERPIGAVIVHDNEIIARGRARHTERESNVAHAEMNALLQSERYLYATHASDCVIYTTVEPCVMCFGAIVMSNIRYIVYGLNDRWIMPGEMLNIDYVHRHVDNYLGGVLSDSCLSLFTIYRPQEIPIMIEGKWPEDEGNRPKE
jgi:tRNA(adenine34) deaminase